MSEKIKLPSEDKVQRLIGEYWNTHEINIDLANSIVNLADIIASELRRTKRDLAAMRNEAELLTKYASFLKSVVRSGESLETSGYDDFEKWSRKYLSLSVNSEEVGT